MFQYIDVLIARWGLYAGCIGHHNLRYYCMMFFEFSESDFFLQFGSNFYEISHLGPGPFNLDLGSGMVKMRSPWR